MKKYMLSITMLFLLACSGDKNDVIIPQIPEASGFEGKTFDHLIFETEQECIDAQPNPDFFINCHREIYVMDDHRVQIMLKDMLMIVEYTIEDDHLIVHFGDNPENFFVYEILSPSSLKLLHDDTVWNERTGNSIWD